MSTDDCLTDEEERLNYLDNAIRRWRERRDFAITEQERLVCTCYVDAYQSVRTTFFGKILPKEE